MSENLILERNARQKKGLYTIGDHVYLYIGECDDGIGRNLQRRWL